MLPLDCFLWRERGWGGRLGVLFSVSAIEILSGGLLYEGINKITMFFSF